MSDPPELPPDQSRGEAMPGQPLLDGLDARRLIADMLASSGPMLASPDWEAPTSEALGAMLHGYQVHRMLGRGGMGAVYLATESRLGRDVAIKLLPPELGQRGDFRQRFEREGWVLAQLDHPHIVRLYSLGESEGGHLYLVMESIDGTSLADFLRDARAGMATGAPMVAWPRCVEIIGQLCEALTHAHAQGLIHRDLKPANVLLTKEGKVKLADFGLARPLVGPRDGVAAENRALLTQTGQLMGTYDYMAPEQRDGLPGDHRVDVYGVGVLLYQMLTGTLPRGAFLPPSALVGTSPEIDRLVMRALATAPADRTPNAEALRTEMLECPEHGPVRRRWPQRWSAAAALLAAGGVASATWLARSPAPVGKPTEGSLFPEKALAPAPSHSKSVADIPGARRSFLGHRLRPLPETPGVFVAEAETTVGQYRRFVAETARPSTPAQRTSTVGDPLAETLTWEAPGRAVNDSDPVVGVSWNDAHDFCHWMTRRARAAGEIELGQEYRLPDNAEWAAAESARADSSPAPAGLRLEEWLIDTATFNRLWHLIRAPRPAGDGQAAASAPMRAVHDGGTTDRGFRIALDLKDPQSLPVSARLWAVADAWGGGDDGRPPVEVLVSADKVKININRRPDIIDLEPLRGLGLTEFWAAPKAPIDLTPLGGQPVRLVYLGGPVSSLEPLAGSPVALLSLGEFDLVPPTTRRPLPSLKPLLGERRLSHLSWRCGIVPSDVPLREFPGLVELAVWDCELESLAFLGGASIDDVTIDRTNIADREGWDHLRRIRKLERVEHVLAEADQRVLDGDVPGALQSLQAFEEHWQEARWFDGNWESTLNRRHRLWNEWQANGIADWWRAGAIGPPPGSREWRGRWFYFLDAPLTRAEAENCAASWGGHLATLADPEEETFVRASVWPVSGSAGPPDRTVDAHLGAWRGGPGSQWHWVTGEAWENQSARAPTDPPSSGFLLLRHGEPRWLAERNRQRFFPALIEWGTPEETAALRALERQLQGTWVLDDGVVLELGPRGRLGPGLLPGSRWFVVQAAAGKALVSRFYGKNLLALATTPDATTLEVTRPDGTTMDARRQR